MGEAQKNLFTGLYKKRLCCRILNVVMAVERFLTGENRKYICGILTAVSVFLFMKYVLALILPFFLALCVILVMQPLLRKLERKLHVGKGILAGLLFLVMLLVVGAALWYGVSAFCAQIRLLSCNMDRYEDSVCRFVHLCCCGLERHMGVDGAAMEKLIFARVDDFTREVKLKAIPLLMNRSVSYARGACSVAATLFMTFIAVILLAKDYRKIRADLRRFGWFRKGEEICGAIVSMVGHYVRAQAIILLVITVLCVAGLWAAGIGHFAAAGVLAGILDALPFIGTGFVLIPIALWQLVQGKLWGCVWVLLLYGACALARELLEPKLIGEKMGVYPIVILLSIYTGVKVYGLAGVVLGPFSFLLVREIWRRMGYLGYFQESD